MDDETKSAARGDEPASPLTLTRRALLTDVGVSIGALALSSLVAEGTARASQATRGNAPTGPSTSPLAPKPPHFRPRAKRVIALHMVGAPSQLDLFDPKPVLQRHDGQPMPDSLLAGQRFAFLRGHPRLMGSPFEFGRQGRSGIEISELLPHFASVVDQVTLIRSMHTDQINHGPAQILMQTGFARPGRPSMGSWLSYGLGTENQNLPSFVVLLSGSTPGGGTPLWSSGFLPTVHQGVRFRSGGDPVLFLSDPDGIDRGARRRIIDAVNRLNGLRLAEIGDPEIRTRISQYEMAFRMQAAVPELSNLASEPRAVLDMYGAVPGQASFANNCLLARRLIERGVRFVQLYDSDWDHHGSINKRIVKNCENVDRPMTALIKDLTRRGLMDETLVVWGGEFGRTPMLQAEDTSDSPASDGKPGRDHHKDAFSVWMAGPGVKRGFVYGATDELGFHVTENPVHVHDLQATILHLLGLDHERLTFKYQGRPFRLTDIEGKVPSGLLA